MAGGKQEGVRLDAASAGIRLRISPRGVLRLDEGGDDGLEPATRLRIVHAFERGPGAAILHLGSRHVATPLPSPLAWLRNLGTLFMTRLCGSSGLEELRDRADIPAPSEELSRLAQSVPPMPGAEYADTSLLSSWWSGTAAEFAHEIRRFKGTVQEWLEERNPVWNLVGRVCFHLAENKRDDEHPFAFLATYTSRISRQGTVQHLPLSDALERYSNARDKPALLSLLVPVQRAAETCELVKELVESGDIYHPVVWSPREAHRFLQDIPTVEAAGVVVRVPEWWNKGRPPRVEVSVSVGGRPPSTLGVDAMLNFSVSLAVGGESITPAEWRKLLKSSDGLALIRGRWVEVDREKLEELLDRFKAARKEAEQGGISFAEAMKLLATGGADGAADGWSRVEPGDWLAGVLDKLRKPDEIHEVDPGKDLKTELRPYQKEGVRWLRFAASLRLGACLADDMGLGKTVQVLALLLLLKRERGTGPHLLAVPASLIANWQSEIERFAPSIRTLIAHPSAIPSSELAKLPRSRLNRVDVVITTYGSLLRLEWMKNVEWDVVVLDEAQAIKNPSAKQTRAAKALDSKRRIVLTGTPVENRLGDLWSIFDFVNPGLLGSPQEFNRFARKLEDGRGYGPLRALIRPYILRRLKTDPNVIRDLPDKSEVRAYCGLTKIQAVLYGKAVEELRRALEELERIDDIRRRGIVLAFLTRFKQICNHPSQWLGDGEYAPEASGKFERLREIAESISAKQDKALIFTQFREMTEPLASFLRGVFGRPGLVLHGGTPVRERPTLVGRFQEDDRVPFFVLSVRAGGTGLNLAAASHVVHFDRWWNPAVENQATDRAYRIGQKKNVLVHKFVCRGTVEEKIDAMLESKKGLSRELLDGAGEAALTEMSDKELLETVSLDLRRATEYL